MKKNTASQRIGCQMVSASDGSAFTGSVTVYVTLDAGTQAIGSVGSGACTHEGNGYHTYAPAQAETNGDLAAFTFIGTGAVPATVQVFTSFPQTGDAFDRLGAPAGASVSADVAAVKAETASIQSDTNDIQTRIPAALVSGRIDASVGAMASGVLTATAIAADAITDAKVAADVTIASVTGAVGSVTGAVGSVTGNVGGNVTGSVGSVVGNVGGNVTGSVGSIATGGISSTSFAAGAIDAAAIAANAIGASELAADAVAEIADAVWDEAISGHATSGSTGEALSAAGAAGDPWITALPGSYSAGQAGYIVGTNLNATVSSRATQTSVDTVDTVVDAILVDTAEIGVAGAGLTALATQASVNTIDDFLDTEVAAIKAKTDLIPAAPAAVGDIPTAVENADALLGRNVSGGSSSGRTVKQAFHFIRNRWVVSSGTLTVYDTDDSTSSWTASVTGTAGADPVTASDPA